LCPLTPVGVAIRKIRLPMTPELVTVSPDASISCIATPAADVIVPLLVMLLLSDWRRTMPGPALVAILAFCSMTMSYWFVILPLRIPVFPVTAEKMDTVPPAPLLKSIAVRPVVTVPLAVRVRSVSPAARTTGVVCAVLTAFAAGTGRPRARCPISERPYLPDLRSGAHLSALS
jgi:hypothetical protein